MLRILLVKATNKQNKEELEFITKFYDQNFNAEELQAHLDIMSSNIPTDQHVHDHSILSYLRDTQKYTDITSLP